MPESAAVIAAVFFVAVLYSSVGHGGASGYLAVMALFSIAAATASTGALVLNVLVAGTAWAAFRRAGHFQWSLTWPFLLGSVPLAFAGGLLKTSEPVFKALLAFALACAALRMFLPDRTPDEVRGVRPLPAAWIGGGIGMLSGIVGVGGGIFLSPLMILMRWAEPKAVAATSACFIVINSVAALAARFVKGGLETSIQLPWVAAAFAGGLLGSRLGARRLGTVWLRRLLGVVLLIAAVKLFL